MYIENYRRATEFDSGHDTCRSKVCAVCYEKASHILSDLEIKTVNKSLIDGYKSTHPDFPCGICTGCSIALSRKRKDFEIPVLESYFPERKVGLRSVGTCLRRICTVAKSNGLSALQLSWRKRKRGRPTSKPVPNHIKFCSNCFSTIANSSNHTAVQWKNSKRKKVEKLVNISCPSTLQRAALHDWKTSDCPVTPLGRLKKKRKKWRKLYFHPLTAQVCNKI